MPHGCDDDKVPRTTRDSTSETSLSVGIGRREERRFIVAPVNNIERRAAKKLAASDNINYTEALRRIRNSGTKPSDILAGQSVTVPVAQDDFIDRTMQTLTALGGFIIKNNEFALQARLVELLESGVHPTLSKNIVKMLTVGTPTGKAKAANALIRVLAQWDQEKKHNPDVDMKIVAGHANGGMLTGWSLGNLLEELDTTVPLNGCEIDLTAEKDWTELSSRVEGAAQLIPDADKPEGITVRQFARGAAALGLASLHGVEKAGWFMVRSGWETKVSKEQQEQIEQHGNEFVLWAGTAENVESIIRAAGEHRTLAPEVLKPLVDAGK